MASELDPLSQIYNAAWARLETSARVQSLVRTGNQIKFNKTSRISPEKFEISDGDLPELILTVSQLEANLLANSSSSRFLLKMEFWISTGDPRVVASSSILPLIWAIFCAMATWPGPLLDLTWFGQRFVTRTDLKEGTTGLTDQEKNRGVRGWSCIWGLEVELYVTTSNLFVGDAESGLLS